MKFDMQTLIIMALAGYVLFRPQPSQLKDQAAMLKSIAALVAAIAVLKSKLGKMQKLQDTLKRKLEELHGVSVPGGKPVVDVEDEADEAWAF